MEGLTDPRGGSLVLMVSGTSGGRGSVLADDKFISSIHAVQTFLFGMIAILSVCFLLSNRTKPNLFYYNDIFSKYTQSHLILQNHVYISFTVNFQRSNTLNKTYKCSP